MIKREEPHSLKLSENDFEKQHFNENQALMSYIIDEN